MSGNSRVKVNSTIISRSIICLAVAGLIISNAFLSFTPASFLTADEEQSILPEEFPLADPAAPAPAQGAESAETPESAASEPAAENDAAPQVPLPDVVDEAAAVVEEGDSYTTDNPKAPDARVKPVTQSATEENETSPDSISESVEDVTPPKMEETIITQEVDDDGDENNAEKVGFPNAQEALKAMYDDVIGGTNTRRVNPVYKTWQRYAASILEKTNKFYTGLELNNRCRLRWYDQLYRNPVSSVFYAEVFSRELYANISSKNPKHIVKGIRQARSKLDIVPSGEDIHVPHVTETDAALAYLRLALEAAAKAHSRAIAPLTPDEVRIVSKESFTVFSAQTRVGHTVPSIQRGQYLIDIMDKMDYSALFDAGEFLIPLTERHFLDILSQIDISQLEQVRIGGKVCGRIPTAAGDILIGGPEDNEWDLDSKELETAVCVIDLGGNDTYREGVCNPGRPVFVLIDLGKGNDQYTGTRPGIQGSAILGVSLLYNDEGDTTYTARDISQGSSIGGIGILIDNSGNDKYNGFKRVQGTAICGLGLLLDRSGDDYYHAALLAQAIGGPRGFGALADLTGNDYYYVGGYYLDSYPEPEYPGYDGWAQGIGAGIRGVACGGIGAFMEGDGDDVYEFDYFGHGGGYWMGVGFARDFGGNDKRIGATVKAFNGGPRSEARHQRFSNGFGCHYAIGFLFDDAGDDYYTGTIMGLGMAWDLGAGFLVDFSGNDIYAGTGGLVEGVGAEGGLGYLLDYQGDDDYQGGYGQMNQGYANSRITYHSAHDCGGNFSFLVDHGGNDKYSCKAQNNTMTQRGMNTGFIIDRPTSEELAQILADGQEVALDDKTPLEKTKQNYTSDPNAEWTANRYSDSVNPSSGGFGSQRGGEGMFGWGRGGGFWGH